MQPRVTAILVAHGDRGHLERTLASLARQTRRPDVLIVIDAAPSENSTRLIAAAAPALHLTAKPGATFGSAVAEAVSHARDRGEPGTHEWLWLLSEDNTADPHALEQLLTAVEIAPSVVVAGPKLLSADDPSTLVSLGETITTLGTSVRLVENEHDQSQYDTRDDVLGVAAAGMVVRHDVWSRLGGFDPGLPSIDASLDFSIRTRLAGHRVVVVPSARVASAGGPETFGRSRVSAPRRHRIARAAQLHRRLVYAPAWAVPLHWLTLLPLALLRAAGHLIAKRPGRVTAEFTVAITAMLDTGIVSARRNLRRTRSLGWAAIDGLRMPTSELRELRAQQREADAIARAGGIPRAPRTGFVSGGGIWVVLVMAVAALIAYGPLLGSSAIAGGRLLPLSPTIGELWANTGVGWRADGLGTWGAADPFAYVLAALGTLTFWSPSLSLIVLWFAALPAASLGAWLLARRLTSRRWLPILAAVAWPLAGPLTAALAAGDPAAVIVHIGLPWLTLLALSARRSWAAAAGSAIVLSIIGASAPILIPALLTVWLLLIATHPVSAHRLLAIPFPLAALFAPLVIDQIARGTPLATLADPGVPVARKPASAWQLALGDVGGTWHGWEGALSAIGLPPGPAPIIVAALTAPIIVHAVLALFLPRTRHSLIPMIAAVLGLATALTAGQLHLSSIGTDTVAVSASSGVSLYWLGLILAALAALDTLGRAAEPLGALAGLTAALLAVPLLIAMLLGTSDARPGNGRTLPALVSAIATTQPTIGTLLITAVDDGIVIDLQRGSGTTLDDSSTLAHTAQDLGANRELARIGGNLAFSSGYNASENLAPLGIGFIVVTRDGDPDVRRTITDTLDANEHLTPVGESVAGQLWRLDAELTGVDHEPSASEKAWEGTVRTAHGILFGIAALLALPVGGVRAPRAERSSDDPADTFDGSDDE